MPTAVLLDLYNTLVRSGSDVARDQVKLAMGADLGVDPPEHVATLFRQSYPQRYVGALGDLESTVRTVAHVSGVTPSPSQVRLAAARRRAFARDLMWPSPSTLEALDALRAAGWR